MIVAVLALRQFVELAHKFSESLGALAEADNYESDDPLELAQYLRTTIAPMMTEVRGYADSLEAYVAQDLWPLPSYRELLFFK